MPAPQADFSQFTMLTPPQQALLASYRTMAQTLGPRNNGQLPDLTKHTMMEAATVDALCNQLLPFLTDAQFAARTIMTLYDQQAVQTQRAANTPVLP